VSRLFPRLHSLVSSLPTDSKPWSAWSEIETSLERRAAMACKI